MRKLKVFAPTLSTIVLTMILILISAVLLIRLDRAKNSHVSDTYPLDIEVSLRKNSFEKSEYVVLDVVSTNVSDFDISYPSGADCPFGKPKVFVDSIAWPINDGFTACTLPGLPPLGPGASFNSVVELDLSYLESGSHGMYAEYAFEGPDGREDAVSEKSTTTLLPADNSTDCATFTAYPSTLCDNILITAIDQENNELNNKTCALLKKQVTNFAPVVNFIPSLSTIDCDTGKPSVFVVNTYPNQLNRYFDQAVERLIKRDEAVCSNTRFSFQRIESTPKKWRC